MRASSYLYETGLHVATEESERPCIPANSSSAHTKYMYGSGRHTVVRASSKSTVSHRTKRTGPSLARQPAASWGSSRKGLGRPFRARPRQRAACYSSPPDKVSRSPRLYPFRFVLQPDRPSP